MKNIIINKYKKKIKVVINKNSVFEIIGPLGILKYNFEKLGFSDKLKYSFFLPKKYLIFFVNKIKYLFRSISVGWFKELYFKGIGYKCFKMNDRIALDLGYSNLIVYKQDSSIKVRNLKNKLVLFSVNRDHMNNVVDSLRKYSVPDVYKGKGIWFKNEIFKLKKKKSKK